MALKFQSNCDHIPPKSWGLSKWSKLRTGHEMNLSADVLVLSMFQWDVEQSNLVGQESLLWRDFHRITWIKMANKNTDASTREVYTTVIKVFHLITAIQFCFAVYYDYAFVHVPSSALRSNRTTFGGKFKFLTFIDGVNKKKNFKLKIYTYKFIALWF